MKEIRLDPSQVLRKVAIFSGLSEVEWSELAQRVVPVLGREGHDYVLIARTETLTRSFAELENDLSAAISALHAALDRRNRERPE